MSHDTNHASKASSETICLLEVGLHPREYGPPLYTIMLMEEKARRGKDRPLTDEDGYIVWFPDPRDAERALALGDATFRGHAPPPTEIEYPYDFARMFWMLDNESTATSGETVENLNLLLDLVEATEFPFPEEYRSTLFALADHLTFSHEYGDFMGTGRERREQVMHAVTWCIGAVAIKSRVLPPAKGDPKTPPS